MVKSRRPTGKKKAQKQVPQQRSMAQSRAVLKQRVPRLLQTLDRAAIEWANLLMDPCNGRLTYACYPVGGSGTVLMRLEADSILWSGGTETAGYTAFFPGLGVATANFTALTSDTATSTLTRNASISPGDGFLAVNAFSLRAIAACTQLMYPGSELNRAGVVSIGVAPAGGFINGLTTGEGGGNAGGSAQSYRILTQHVERVPATMLECKWFPGDEDSQPTSYVNRPAAWAPLLNGRNAIVASASGFPVGTGIRIRNVAIYELSLNSNQTSGQVQAVTPPASNNNTGHVIKALYDKDPQWYIDSAAKLVSGARTAMSYARAGVKAAGTVVNGLALLAA